LGEPDFQAGKVDTGYLDRLLKSKPTEAKHEEHIAAVAAGFFAILEPSPTVANGDSRASSWKKAARVDALRGTS
jgi:hypothetical protein